LFEFSYFTNLKYEEGREATTYIHEVYISYAEGRTKITKNSTVKSLGKYLWI